jgi:hypothetical protein
MKKFALFAFNGDPMCFVHVLLNTLDMEKRGHTVKLVIEGSATKLIPDLAVPGAQFGQLFEEIRNKGLIDCVCNACAEKMGVISSVRELDLPLCAEMKGHPSMARYLEEGYEVITF